MSAGLPKAFKGQPVERGVEHSVEWVTYPAPLYGAINGYAHLPEGHPWRDLDLQCDDYEQGPKIHGGVTYGPTAEGWIGFDTLHAGDYWPGTPRAFGDDRHWTAAQVADEARSLARQIAKASVMSAADWQPSGSVEEDLRSRLLCIAEATCWDRPYDERIAAIRGLCDLTTNGLTPIDDKPVTA